jgi:tetratricopeptide (TPR) repeat protein
MKIRLVTVVWGDFFVDIFLRVTVRSLLAEGNAGDLAKRHSVLYTIQTTAEDKRVLEASPAFQALAAAVPINFQVFNPAEINPNDLAQHWYFWRQVAEIARPSRELLFFIIPDMLFGAGTLIRWAGFFEEGRHAVWSSVPQVALETALEELEERFPPSGEAPISLDMAEVHKFFLRQMHPYMITMFRDGRRWLRHPEIVFTSVPGEGLAMRAICSHLFCIDLNHFTLTDAFSPIDRLEDIAYDQASHGVCLERLMKHTDLYYQPNQMDSDRLSNLGTWLDGFCTPADMLESYHTYRFCGRELADNKKFRRAEASLGFYACQVRLTGSIYRMVRAMRSTGCGLSARIVAAAHYSARLRRHWRIKGEATLFVPTDNSIEALTPPVLKELLSPGNEKALADIVLAHAVPGKRSLAVGDTVVRQSDGAVHSIGTVAGSSFHVAQRGPGAQIVAGPFEVDDCFVYVVDRPLKAPAKQHSPPARKTLLAHRWTSSPRRAMQPVALPVARAIEQPQPYSQPRPAFPTSKAAAIRMGKSLIRSAPGANWFVPRAKAMLGLMRHPTSAIRRLESTARVRSAALRGALPGAIKSKVRAVARVGYHTALAVPGLGRIARRARESYYAMRQGHMLATHIVSVEAATPAYQASAAEFAPEVFTAAQLPLSVKADGSPQPKLSLVALEGLYDVQAAQAVRNLAELLQFYHGKVAGLVPEFPPLDMVERCLGQSGISDERLMAELRRVLETQPDFSEAWLELGYLYHGRGNVLAAEQCWAECVASLDYVAVPGDRVGCKPLAAFARAKSLEARGRLAAAADAYGAAVTMDARMKMAHLAYAKVLRRLGRIDEALVQFEASLDTDGTAAPFGKLPRTFEGLSARLLTRFPKADENRSGPDGTLTVPTTYAGVNSGSLA